MALIVAVTAAPPADAGCLQDIASLERQVRAEVDWLRRETILAMLIEAKREAIRGREQACRLELDRARTQQRR